VRRAAERAHRRARLVYASKALARDGKRVLIALTLGFETPLVRGPNRNETEEAVFGPKTGNPASFPVSVLRQGQHFRWSAGAVQRKVVPLNASTSD